VERLERGTFGATHWNVRNDVQRVAVEVAARYGCTWNTYQDHPPGLGLDAVSVDFWDKGGRGDPLGATKRRRISRYIRTRSGGPPWRWVINGTRGYYPNGSTFRPPGGAEWNAGHVHVTFA
jgi:hypothetical protein